MNSDLREDIGALQCPIHPNMEVWMTPPIIIFTSIFHVGKPQIIIYRNSCQKMSENKSNNYILMCNLTSLSGPSSIA